MEHCTCYDGEAMTARCPGMAKHHISLSLHRLQPSQNETRETKHSPSTDSSRQLIRHMIPSVIKLDY